MNELTAGESLQQILDRRERAAAMSGLASLASSMVVILLATAVFLDLAAATPLAATLDSAAPVVEAAPHALDGLTYAP